MYCKAGITINSLATMDYFTLVSHAAAETYGLKEVKKTAQKGVLIVSFLCAFLDRHVSLLL